MRFCCIGRKILLGANIFATFSILGGVASPCVQNAFEHQVLCLNCFVGWGKLHIDNSKVWNGTLGVSCSSTSGEINKCICARYYVYI